MSKSWQVIYYVSIRGDVPVKNFLDTATPRLKTKALRILFQLEEYGLQTVIPHIKKLSGSSLWEVRILGGESTRILFVIKVGKQIVLLHAFYKKTQKTPLKEIATAMTRLKDYEGRTGN